MVGTSDPVGTYKDRSGRSLPQSEDGPILTACREIRPSRLVLFYTTAGDNDFTENAERVHAFVSAQIPACVVTARPLAPVEDPTDLEVLWEAMVSDLSDLQTGEDADLLGRCNAFVSMSSGTGQMQFVWAELTRTHVLPATLLQVRESRRLKEGESRIRRVVLPSAH